MLFRSRAEADAIQIRDHRQRARETENAVAHARGRFDQRWRGGHFAGAHHGRTSPTVLDPARECNQRGWKKEEARIILASLITKINCYRGKRFNWTLPLSSTIRKAMSRP